MVKSSVVFRPVKTRNRAKEGEEERVGHEGQAQNRKAERVTRWGSPGMGDTGEGFLTTWAFHLD